MKTLYLTIAQAKQLGDDLIEYAQMQDSHERPLFKGFAIKFGDLLAQDIQPGQGFEMEPIPEFTEIAADAE